MKLEPSLKLYNYTNHVPNKYRSNERLGLFIFIKGPVLN